MSSISPEYILSVIVHNCTATYVIMCMCMCMCGRFNLKINYALRFTERIRNEKYTVNFILFRRIKRIYKIVNALNFP